MTGTYFDIARLAVCTSVPKEELEDVGNQMSEKVKEAAEKLKSAIPNDRLIKISNTLYQRSVLDGLQTTAILWLDAYIIQRRLMHRYDIPVPSSLPKNCLESWKKILDINWQSIFLPAVTVLEELNAEAPGQTMEALERLLEAENIINRTQTGMDISIGAELFPKLSSDRKTAAAFYTQAHNAEFLSAMAMPENMADWSDTSLFENFKIADMACGTGTLLRFAYIQAEKYYQQYQRKPDLDKFHKLAIEKGLYGLDISPIASHLTSAGLAMRSDSPYNLSNIGWVQVGKVDKARMSKKKRKLDAVKTGSIEYMNTNAITDLSSKMFGNSTGKQGTNKYNSVKIVDNTFNVIIMNPPYSRTRGGQSAFDVAGLPDNERSECQHKWGHLIKNEACIKTSGMAATFLCLAEKKCKPGGMIGFVLPRTCALVESWKITRNMIEEKFEDITVVAVQSGKALGKNALSADTMMEEIFLIAKKKEKPDNKRSNIRCVTLYDPITRLDLMRNRPLFQNSI